MTIDCVVANVRALLPEDLREAWTRLNGGAACCQGGPTGKSSPSSPLHLPRDLIMGAKAPYLWGPQFGSHGGSRNGGWAPGINGR
eukprot:3491672-Lingulodinium_polyedra.AAC.1